ncbi:MAG: hypothetical protein M0Q13_10985 [Methanothrix sp.]|jgi:hypothetical protein|nr:hypothetical protein [Methanothrix sp.]
MADRALAALQLLASGRLDKMRELLHRFFQLASRSRVALAPGYQQAVDLQQAKEYAMRVLAADPRDKRLAIETEDNPVVPIKNQRTVRYR